VVFISYDLLFNEVLSKSGLARVRLGACCKRTFENILFRGRVLYVIVFHGVMDNAMNGRSIYGSRRRCGRQDMGTVFVVKS